MADFVLVHGTGHGAWCWRKVETILRSAGSSVYAQTLTGVGDRAHTYNRDVNLTTHITDVSNMLFFEDLHDVVLVGHSYAGMVITGVAATTPERIGRLVYFDAYVPDAGQSEFDLWPPEMRAQAESEAREGDGRRGAPPPELMGITDPELAAWVAERTTPHPMATYTEPVPAGDERSKAIPRAFIRCTEGPLVDLFGVFADKARAAGWPVREVAAGHDAMLTAPQEVARALLDLAESPVS